MIAHLFLLNGKMNSASTPNIGPKLSPKSTFLSNDPLCCIAKVELLKPALMVKLKRFSFF